MWKTLVLRYTMLRMSELTQSFFSLTEKIHNSSFVSFVSNDVDEDVVTATGCVAHECECGTSTAWCHCCPLANQAALPCPAETGHTELPVGMTGVKGAASQDHPTNCGPLGVNEDVPEVYSSPGHHAQNSTVISTQDVWRRARWCGRLKSNLLSKTLFLVGQV